jgi:hypothetical protein
MDESQGSVLFVDYAFKKKRYFNWLVVSRHQAICWPTGTSIEARVQDEHYIAD